MQHSSRGMVDSHSQDLQEEEEEGGGADKEADLVICGEIRTGTLRLLAPTV